MSKNPSVAILPSPFGLSVYNGHSQICVQGSGLVDSTPVYSSDIRDLIHISIFYVDSKFQRCHDPLNQAVSSLDEASVSNDSITTVSQQLSSQLTSDSTPTLDLSIYLNNSLRVAQVHPHLSLINNDNNNIRLSPNANNNIYHISVHLGTQPNPVSHTVSVPTDSVLCNPPPISCANDASGVRQTPRIRVEITPPTSGSRVASEGYISTVKPTCSTVISNNNIDHSPSGHNNIGVPEGGSVLSVSTTLPPYIYGIGTCADVDSEESPRARVISADSQLAAHEEQANPQPLSTAPSHVFPPVVEDKSINNNHDDNSDHNNKSLSLEVVPANTISPQFPVSVEMSSVEVDSSSLRQLPVVERKLAFDPAKFSHYKMPPQQHLRAQPDIPLTKDTRVPILYYKRWGSHRFVPIGFPLWIPFEEALGLDIIYRPMIRNMPRQMMPSWASVWKTLLVSVECRTGQSSLSLWEALEAKCLFYSPPEKDEDIAAISEAIAFSSVQQEDAVIVDQESPQVSASLPAALEADVMGSVLPFRVDSTPLSSQPPTPSSSQPPSPILDAVSGSTAVSMKSIAAMEIVCQTHATHSSQSLDPTARPFVHNKTSKRSYPPHHSGNHKHTPGKRPRPSFTRNTHTHDPRRGQQYGWFLLPVNAALYPGENHFNNFPHLPSSLIPPMNNRGPRLQPPHTTKHMAAAHAPPSAKVVVPKHCDTTPAQQQPLSSPAPLDKSIHIVGDPKMPSNRMIRRMARCKSWRSLCETRTQVDKT